MVKKRNNSWYRVCWFAVLFGMSSIITFTSISVRVHMNKQIQIFCGGIVYQHGCTHAHPYVYTHTHAHSLISLQDAPVNTLNPRASNFEAGSMKDALLRPRSNKATTLEQESMEERSSLRACCSLLLALKQTYRHLLASEVRRECFCAMPCN